MASPSSSGADSSCATESFLESRGGGLFVEGGCAGSCCAGADASIVLLECKYQETMSMTVEIIRNAGFGRTDTQAIL